jgi:hypothetical protein
MTETTTPTEQASVDSPELSGIDLARVALRDDREQRAFATRLKVLMSERARALPAAGGSVLDRWPDITPQLPDHVQAVAFHSETDNWACARPHSCD